MISMTPEEIFAHFQMPSDSATNEVYTTVYDNKSVKRIKSQKTELTKVTNEMIYFMFQSRESIVANVFKNRDNKQVNIPVAFTHIIDNIKGQLITTGSIVDITPLETFKMVFETMDILKSFTYAPPSELFKVLYYYY